MPPKTEHEEFAIAPAAFGTNGVKSVKPPFGYYGAKQRLASQIVASLPPHNAWVEVFCGSAAITLAKPPVPIEVINDKNGEIINVFEQLRNNCDELCRAVTFTPYSREEFLGVRDTPATGTPLDRARRFLVAAMMTVNGTVGNQTGFSFSSSYSRGGMEARVSRWNHLPERLAKVAERLRNVRVENRDARELLEMFAKRPATLVYLDPPYFVKRSHDYVIDAKDESFHEELLKLCRKAKCMVLLSGYDTKLYREALTERRGWTRTFIETHTRDTAGNDYARTELLWKNEQFVKATKSGRVAIRLTKVEKQQDKINPERK